MPDFVSINESFAVNNILKREEKPMKKSKVTNTKMSNTNELGLKKDQLPKDCWILRNRMYVYNDAKGYLPYVGAEKKEVLDSLQIPYEEKKLGKKEILSYWDPNVPVEMENHTAPLYFMDSKGNYKYAKEYSFPLVSKKVRDAAQRIRIDVEAAIKKFDAYKHAQNVLNGRVSGVALSTRTVPTHHIDVANSNIYAFSFAVSSDACIEVFFDANRIDQMDYRYLILDVPEELKSYKRWFFGKDSSRVDLWAATIGVKKIFIK